MRNKILSIMFLMVSIFVVGLAAPGTSQAVNTAAGTSISNDVELTFYVGGVLQTTQNLAAPYTFAVDNKVDLTVVKTGDKGVVPGSTNQEVAFTVTNTGNSTQRYALAEEQGANTFSMTSPTIYIDLGVVGTYEAGTDVAYSDASTAGDIAAGGSIDVLIIGDTPIGATNTQTDVHNLLATTVNAGTLVVTAESVGDDGDPDVVDVVFADTSAGPHSGDALEDGEASAAATYTVSSVTLTVAKTSTVISDPINGTTNPIAIPGAIVRYTITVDHTAGATDATSVTISDDLSTEIGNGTIVFNTQHTGAAACGAGEGMVLNLNGAGDVCQTNAVGGDNSEFTGNIVSSSGITLPNGEDAVLTFEVTIQ